jgi:phage shock protein A
MFSTGFWLVVGVVAVLAVFQRKNLGRLLIAFSAQFGKLFKWIWGIDAIAVYQAEVDRSADEIQQAGEGLEQYRGLVSRLQRQVTNGEKETLRLTAKVKTFLTENNEEKAAEYAIQLKKEQTALVENKSQLRSYEDAYQDNLKKVRYANEKIKGAKEKAERMQADLRLSKAEAETAKLAQRFNINTNITTGLGEIEDEIQRQIDSNRAKGQVIRDLSQDGLDQIEEDEKIQKAEAKELLLQFKQEMQNGNRSH